MTDIEKWNICRSRAQDVRHMPSKRSHTVVLSYCGVELASKTDMLKRGKIVSTLFVFTKAGEELCK